MKKPVRILLFAAAFAGFFSISSPNYANPLIQILQTPSGLRSRLLLPRPNRAFLRRKAAADPYVQALKVARALATSA